MYWILLQSVEQSGNLDPVIQGVLYGAIFGFFLYILTKINIL